MFNALACIHTTSRTRWGNWGIESVLAGSLFLGNARSLAQISPLLPGLDCRSLRQGIARANRLIENPTLWSSLQHLQTRIVEHVAFRRPLHELTEKARRFFS